MQKGHLHLLDHLATISQKVSDERNKTKRTKRTGKICTDVFYTGFNKEKKILFFSSLLVYYYMYRRT
ncbi:unnamed protein product [Rhizophagus irregularis]|nr:unnamed protein product [Rhizophagus irregularis]CAB4426969.1 unnamed protein product [Rhizophagus irregularis]